MRRLLSVLSLFIITACGGAAGGEITDPPVTPPKLRDPYATFFFENTQTAALWPVYPAAGAGLQGTRWIVFMRFDTTSTNPNFLQTLASLSTVGQNGDPADWRGRISCGSGNMGGFVGERRISILAVTDTTANFPDAEADSVAQGLVTRPGVIVWTAATFDPLVSADTSRGHTPSRPVMWRVTVSDTGLAVREDSTTGCKFDG